MTNKEAAEHYAKLPPDEDAMVITVDIDDMTVEANVMMSADEAVEVLDPTDDEFYEPWVELRNNKAPVGYVRAR